MITSYSPGVRRVGCLLALLVLIRNFPQHIYQTLRFALPYPVLTFIALVFGARQIRRHDFGISTKLRSTGSFLVSIIRPHLRKIVLRLKPRWWSLSQMTREIVFYYSIAQCLNYADNNASFSWLFSLLSYGVIRDFSLLCIVNESRLSFYRFVPSLLSCIVVVVFMLSKYGLFYLLITLSFYVALQDVFVNLLILKMKSYDFDCFEGLEKFYLKLFKSFVQMVLGVICILVLLYQSSLPNPMTSYAPAILTGYAICHPAFIEAKRFGKILMFYLKQLAYFPKASFQELVNLNDVCAVCLSSMKTARVTPCKHYFHGKCLVRCLKTNSTCPMCKTSLTFLSRPG